MANSIDSGHEAFRDGFEGEDEEGRKKIEVFEDKVSTFNRITMNGPRYEKVIYKHQLVYFSSSKLGVTRPAGWRASACRSDLCFE